MEKTVGLSYMGGSAQNCDREGKTSVAVASD